METIQIPFRKTIIHHEPTCHSWTCNSTIQTPLRSTKQFYIMILLHVIHGHVMKVMHKIMVPLTVYYHTSTNVRTNKSIKKQKTHTYTTCNQHVTNMQQTCHDSINNTIRCNTFQCPHSHLLLLLLPPPRHRHLPHRHLHHLE